MVDVLEKALAQQEREFISTRTKAALAEAKARGVKLGGNRPNNQARHKAVKAMADQNALVVSQIIEDHRKAGKTYRYIAQQMNDLNISTAKNFNMGRAALAYVLALKLYRKVQQSPPDIIVFSLTKVASGLKPSINA